MSDLASGTLLYYTLCLYYMYVNACISNKNLNWQSVLNLHIGFIDALMLVRKHKFVGGGGAELGTFGIISMVEKYIM